MNNTLFAKTLILFVQLSKLSGSSLIYIVTGLEVSVLAIVGAVAVLIYFRRKRRARVLSTGRGPAERPGGRKSCQDIEYDEIDDRKPPPQGANRFTVSNVYSTMTRDSTEVCYTEIDTDTIYTDGLTPVVVNADTGAQAITDNAGYLNVSSSESATTVDVITENIYSCVREELSMSEYNSRNPQPTPWKRVQSQYINDAFEDDVES